MSPRRKLFTVIVLILALLFSGASLLSARAGGAGGSSSSSSSSGSSHSGGGSYGGGGGGGDAILIVYYLVRAIGPIPTLVLVVVVIGVGSFAARKNVRLSKTAYRNLRMPPAKEKIPGFKPFLTETPDFNENEFLGKAKKAFYAIQEAWSAQDLSKVRKFISDGVYQRFNTQFKMMALLKQKNVLTDVRIEEMYIDKVERDGAYDIIHVGIQASLKDEFVCDLDHSIDSGGFEEFFEYWSFLRRRGVPKKDLYDSELCPNCSAPLPESPGEIASCTYCGTLVNSGEYDWVLSEITQADDYSKSAALEKAQNLSNKTASLSKEYTDFSVQLLEDKASNGYLQILTAYVYRDPSLMRRFASDKAYENIMAKFPDSQIVFNRLYLNAVTLIGAFSRNDENLLAFSITSSFQRVLIENGASLRLLDPSVVMSHEIMLMSRHKDSLMSKGSLYLHLCSSCGAPVKDTVDSKCFYCGNVLNNNRREWIVEGLLSPDEYRAYLGETAGTASFKMDPHVLDDLYDVKDYALNNIMIVVSADGEFSEDEEKFAVGLAKRWGYNPQKLKPIFRIAANGRLVIRMPDNPRKRAEIYELMKKAANADNELSESERRILDYVKETYLPAEVKS